jgi:hypothetical protein
MKLTHLKLPILIKNNRKRYFTFFLKILVTFSDCVWHDFFNFFSLKRISGSRDKIFTADKFYNTWRLLHLFSGENKLARFPRQAFTAQYNICE